MLSSDLENRFKSHPPKDEETKEKHEFIRQLCLALATEINNTVPDGRQKSLAITHLEEVMMWSNKGIAEAK